MGNFELNVKKGKSLAYGLASKLKNKSRIKSKNKTSKESSGFFQTYYTYDKNKHNKKIHKEYEKYESDEERKQRKYLEKKTGTKIMSWRERIAQNKK